jgi:hypothetical protein
MAAALARILVVACFLGAAAIPAYVAQVRFAAWGLGAMAVALALRLPMAGLCVLMGSGAYLLLTALALVAPGLLGPSGLLDDNGWMQACAWLTLVAAVLAQLLITPLTFVRAFRQEGRPAVVGLLEPGAAALSGAPAGTGGDGAVGLPGPETQVDETAGQAAR